MEGEETSEKRGVNTMDDYNDHALHLMTGNLGKRHIGLL